MAVTTKKTFPATTNATTTVFSPVSIQLNNQDDLDVYVTLSGGTRVLQLRQSTGSTAQSSHPQVNNTDGLYFPAVSAGTTLYNYTLSSDNNTITFNSALPSGAVVFCERRTRDADSAYTSFASGSTIRATDLNNSSTESNFTAQDARNKALDLEGSIFNGVQPTINGVAQPFVNSAKIIDGSIVDADINASAAIAQSKIATGTLPSGVQINSSNIVDGSIVDADINSSAAISHSKLNLNIVNSDINASANIAGSKLADDSVTLAKLGSGALPTDITVASANIVDGTIVNADINSSADISGSKLANDSVTLAKLGSGALPTDITVDSANLQSNSVTTDKIADSELSTLAGMQSGTASRLADSTALTATTAELNQLDGITLETTLTSSDTRIPTSKAVNDQILAVTNALGGFVAIANETSFPTANPDPSNGAGTVVSISQVSSGSAVSINSSGVATISNGAGSGNTVTITGFPTTLRNTSLAANSGLQVQTTTTLHTYTFHKQLASAADISAISATVNSFSNRYRVSSSAPTSSLDGGDLWYDTTNSKLMVYSSQNSAWEESSAIGNFFISTISSSSSTGGGSATANGTAYRFTISNAPTDAQQLLVSVDGVIQKPNAGSSQPSEGFVLVGNDIIFGAPPANGASMFVTVIGSTVGIGTPSNNTVTNAILQNGSVSTAKIQDDAVDANKLANDAVTFAKLQNVASQTIFGRAGGGTGDPTALSATDVRSIINVENGATADQTAAEIRTLVESATDSNVFTDADHTKLNGISANAIDGSALNASNLSSGTIPDARFPSTLPTVSGANLTNLNGSNIASGTVPVARIGTGTKNTSTFYRGDGTFATVTAPAITAINGAGNNRLITSDGGTTVTAEDSLTFDGTTFASTGLATFNGGTTNGGNDATVYITATTNNDWGLLVNKNNGSATNYGIQIKTGASASHAFYIVGGGTETFRIAGTGTIENCSHIYPRANNTYDLGSSSYRWRNVYTNDLHLSNKGSSNDVDSTWGDWTIQEGESDLFLKNNRSGKKYKFNLTEVS